MAKKKLTRTQLRKRSEVAEAVKRERPGISVARSFKIASAAVRKKKSRHN